MFEQPQNDRIVIAHLTASPFYGGPERQMLGLTMRLPAAYRSVFLSFEERGLSRPFLDKLEANGIQTITLEQNTPHLFRAAAEVASLLRQIEADVLCCHGYKPDLVGLIAAKRAGVPVISVSRGWTAASWKVALYEKLDRRVLRYMNAVACVSNGQARKVLRCGVGMERVRVIHNSIDPSRFSVIDPRRRQDLLGLFRDQPEQIVLAAGRLSPEKGFDQLIAAAEVVLKHRPGVGFVVFGDGPLRQRLQEQIDLAAIGDRFQLAGFRDDLDALIGCADLMVLPSYTEGLPNVALEALAAGVPVVATAVGGTPEVVLDGQCGYLVPAGDTPALARRIGDLLADEDLRRQFATAGRTHVETNFSFDAQAAGYHHLLQNILRGAALPDHLPENSYGRSTA